MSSCGRVGLLILMVVTYVAVTRDLLLDLSPVINYNLTITLQ